MGTNLTGQLKIASDPAVPFVAACDQDLNGGSQPVKLIRFSCAFDTPDLVLTGVPIYTPSPGDLIVPGYPQVLSKPTAFDGSTPTPHFGILGNLTAFDSVLNLSSFDLTDEPDTPIAGTASSQVYLSDFGGGLLFGDDTPLYMMIDDGSGGDPGSTEGELTLFLLVYGTA